MLSPRQARFVLDVSLYMCLFCPAILPSRMLEVAFLTVGISFTAFMLVRTEEEVSGEES